jgi:hypothetical protein
MKFRVQWWVIGAARRISRTAWSSLLPLAGISCLAVAGCSGSFSPVQQQQARLGAQNTLYTIQDLGVFGPNPNAPGGPLVVTDSGWISGAAGIGPEGTCPGAKPS